ncbi:LVIVD repeat-containing protein [Silvibacterium dinghuense]|uniref:LVIVD repeat-containing protein n=1 Tax=Silvibacterium dinghuense TaxID=1560006 RepID=A0A4Q1SEA7_9BACT|nr:hypothetical protein [Silvibacterium dinghuense]RXS95599.1 hypothetical protein ESZ00_13635 [Silvibacterium dinghuense]GGH14304.1 hypothetical protein GCM10011586_34690 [Silvibacterium dinghuense]
MKPGRSRQLTRITTLAAAALGTVLAYGQSMPTPDPRVGLKAGLHDAGEAQFGLQRLASLPKPAPFEPPPSAANSVMASINYANSDIAFQGGHLFLGNFYGVNIYDIAQPAKISLLTSLVCPGGQGDVSVYGKLLFMSVEMSNGRLDCGTQGFPAPPPPPAPAPGQKPEHPLPAADPARFRGLRIFDISDINQPKQVAAVQTCRGSHTHTLVMDPKDPDNLYVYISGTSYVRSPEELEGCSGKQDEENSRFSIDVVKVPLAHPEKAEIVASPRVFSDAQTGAVNGLWKGGNHGDGTQTTSRTDACHDITVYSAIGLAAGACSGNGLLLDISDPEHPKRIEAVSDPNYAYWHSATFSNDGSKLVYTDEWGGGIQPRCRATDPKNWGADAIYSLHDHTLTEAGYYKMPAPQTEMENCVAHNGSLIPVPGRDIEVQAWYQGGVSVMDFTDPKHPFEIAYFDRGPIDATKRVLGGYWSAYWYNGFVYGSEIARGIDVFQLVPSAYLTQNEIDAARQVQVNELNVQNQQRIVWPPNLVTARAYVDQLARSKALPAKQLSAVESAIGKAGSTSPKKKELAKLHALGAKLISGADAAKSPEDANRMKALGAILTTYKA